MPVTDMRLNNIMVCLGSVVTLLSDLNDVSGTPFLTAISSMTQSLITALQNTKKIKDEYTQLMENIYSILYAIIDLHGSSTTVGNVPPTYLTAIAKFTETLRKILAFVELQGEGNKIKQFFRQAEKRALLKDCQTELTQVQRAFRIQFTPALFSDLHDMQDQLERLHDEVLEVISKMSIATFTDEVSFRQPHGAWGDSQNSSNFLSLLPAEPKIFHGRERELASILQTLSLDAPHIVILGTGGIGKTSLAKAVIHHEAVARKYQERFFIACDSVSNRFELADAIGAYVGLKPAQDLTKPVIRHLEGLASTLLILDNFETAWEPVESREGVEDLLSLLTSIPTLALIITMRGAERPAKVRWTRPFLPPLSPLSDDAARQTFIDIAEDDHDAEQMAQILSLTDNMPLAVDLIAHLVDYEGCTNVLARWETEKTALLSAGYDKRSNLDASIRISLSSPRIAASPDAKSLLGLLSMLPDGLSDVELLQSDLPIPDVVRCKTALLSTSLAYIDARGRVKCLAPIRDHMQAFFPPTAALVQAMRAYFHLLLAFFQKYGGSYNMAPRTNQITSNLGNIHQLLRHGLRRDNPDLTRTIECVLLLNHFRRQTGPGWSVLMDQIPHVLPQPCDHRLEAQFVTEKLSSQNFHPIVNIETLFDEGEFHFQHFSDPALEAQFAIAKGFSHISRGMEYAAGFECFHRALSLARACGDSVIELVALNNIADLHWRVGEYAVAIKQANEARKRAQWTGNLSAEAITNFTAAVCSTALGDYTRSASLLRRAKELLELCDMEGGSLHHAVANGEAETHLMKSEYTEARRIHIEAFQHISAEQDAQTHAWALLNIAEIDLRIPGSDEKLILEYLERAKAILSGINQVFGTTLCDIFLCDLSLRQGDAESARKMVRRCLKSSWEAQVTTACLQRLANASLWIPLSAADDEIELTWQIIYFAHAQISQEKFALHEALQFLGDIFMRAGDDATAQTLLSIALDGFTYMDVHRSRADCMVRLGTLAQRRGDSDGAAKLWREARPLYTKSLQTGDISEIDIRLATLSS